MLILKSIFGHGKVIYVFVALIFMITILYMILLYKKSSKIILF